MRLCAFLLTGCIAYAQGVSPTRKAPAPEFPRRIILDTDPGIDDAMAVLLALRSPELKVEAITAVAGNVPVELGAENARKLIELAGRTDVIVAKGAARPLKRKLITAEAIHGENGLGGVLLPAPKIGLDRRHAVQVIHDLIETNPGQITLVPVGPLTNIAMSFQQYPGLAAKTREIILMGGTVGAGNATPAAEANIYHDAEAAKVVFESGVPILMVDLTAASSPMSFASIEFVAFFAAVLFGLRVMPTRDAKFTFLLFANLLFYAAGTPWFVLVLLVMPTRDAKFTFLLFANL